MTKLSLFFALVIVGLTVAVPARKFQVRRLDPSAPEEIEDFEVSKDEDTDSIDAGATNSEVPDSPSPPFIIDGVGEDEDYNNDNSQRQEARLAYLSANYEQLSAQDSQIFANLQLSEGNQAEVRSNIEEDRADALDLDRFSDWLGEEANAQKEFAEELNGTPDASGEARIGEILEEMSNLAAKNAELRREGVAKEEKQVELESSIHRDQQEEAKLKSEQSELQLDQIYLEHDMIDNEHRFKKLRHMLIEGDYDGYEYASDESGYIGTGDEDEGEGQAQETEDQNQGGDEDETAATAE